MFFAHQVGLVFIWIITQYGSRNAFCFQFIGTLCVSELRSLIFEIDLIQNLLGMNILFYKSMDENIGVYFETHVKDHKALYPILNEMHCQNAIGQALGKDDRRFQRLLGDMLSQFLNTLCGENGGCIRQFLVFSRCITGLKIHSVNISTQQVFRTGSVQRITGR